VQHYRSNNAIKEAFHGKSSGWIAKSESICVGIDVHKRGLAVVVPCHREEVYHAVTDPDLGALVKILNRFEASDVHIAYEERLTGSWLDNGLVEVGFDSMVKPS